MPNNLDELNAEILGKLDGQAKADFKAGLRKLGMVDLEDRAALRDAFKRANPNASEKQLDIMVDGKAPRERSL